jgi:hypothetical protein
MPIELAAFELSEDDARCEGFRIVHRESSIKRDAVADKPKPLPVFGVPS